MGKKTTKSAPAYSGALKAIYTVFLGVIIALFFGLGVAAFYPSPKEPMQPITLAVPEGKNCDFSEKQKAEQIKLEHDQRDFQEKLKLYSRNVSTITIVLSILAVAGGLLFLNHILLLSDGLLLGGVFTLAYSIIRGFMSEDVHYRFVVVSIGLLVTVLLGYIKFIRQQKSK